jgi:ATP-binding cassette subfamily C protein CydC
LKLMLPQWRWALLGIFLSLVTLLSNVGLLALSSWFITSMAVAGSMGIFMDATLAAAGVRALALIRSTGRYAERLVNHETTFRILAGLRVWFFRRLEPLAPARLALHRGGDLLSRIRADIDTLDDFYVRGVVPSLVALLAIPCILVFLARFDARLAWIQCAALAAAGVLLPLALGRLAERPGRECVECAAELRALVVEETQGMAELVALGAVEAHAERMERAGLALDRRQRSLASLQGIGEAGLVAMGPMAVWAGVLLLATAVSAGSIGPAEMAMLLIIMLASLETVLPLPGVIQRAGEMAAAAKRLFEIIDATPAVPEHAPGAASAPILPPAKSAGLSIRGLRFRYAADGPWVFDGLAIDIPKAGRVGIVGPTGSGKSTLVNVLLRFWDYEEGTIMVLADTDRDLRSRSPEDARRLFSVLSQPPYLFHTTIRENLLLAGAGTERAFSGEELFSALAAAQLADLVRGLPEGLDTMIGEHGRALSIGEAQRLAMARALLKEAPIFLLDEPTEGLDDRTADALLSSVERRLRGRTLVLISHRERDLSIVDEVVDFRAGRATRRLSRNLPSP